jgi:site-specific DNA-cytosine methylase
VILNENDHGVPQRRQRFVVVAHIDGYYFKPRNV